MIGAEAPIRQRVEYTGRVQGVGFRPWIFRIAQALGLAGHVGNNTHGAFVEIEGSPARLALFHERVAEQAPPLVEIRGQSLQRLPTTGRAGFRIAASSSAGPLVAEVSPDMASCEACLREARDPADRRHGYAFINCTDCGPRYSIVEAIPYDRATTTMSAFTMCPTCQAEYDDPWTRRFHAQPNACPVCGPELLWVDPRGEPLAGDPITEARARLRAGEILAIKGIGGFHLACLGSLESAVARLRERKQRASKPLALMVSGLDDARALVNLSPTAQKALLDPSRPIVLAPRLASADIAPNVAPGTDRLGIMLPYTPLHVLLFGTEGERLGPLVMTSANSGGEPLAHTLDAALRGLADVASAFLSHNRDIARPIDDSVVVCHDAGGRVVPIRRGRGQAPRPLPLPTYGDTGVAVGGDLKSAVAIASRDQVILSEHLGDLDRPATYRHFAAALDRLTTLYEVRPQFVACDLHPGYHSTRYAKGLGLEVVEVQHHHAHVVAAMVEHRLSDTVVGVACDGTGYGLDGSVWGGEVLVAQRDRFERAAHLPAFTLVGGDRAARDTWRPAAGLLHAAFGDDWTNRRRWTWAVPPEAIRVWRAQARRAPRTSSTGRLFDAVAWILGVEDHNDHEAKAAIALESLARGVDPIDLGVHELDSVAMAVALAEAMDRGTPAEVLASSFHRWLADGLAAAAHRAHPLAPVVLTGGSFANALLATRVHQRLTRLGRDVYLHHHLPTTDGGLAVGQLGVALARRASR